MSETPDQADLLARLRAYRQYVVELAAHCERTLALFDAADTPDVAMRGLRIFHALLAELDRHCPELGEPTP